MTATTKAHLALFSVALIYGANYSIAKLAMDEGHIQPLGFIFFRMLSGLVLFGLIYRLKVKEKVARGDFGRLMLCGLFGVAINQMFFFSGLKLTTPISAALIMTTTPILVLLASAIIIGERITPRKILGIIIGAAGAILLITYGKTISFAQEQFWGNLMILINALSYGVYLVFVKSLMDRYNPITVVFWVFLFGLIFSLPFCIQEALSVNWTGFSTVTWMAFIYVLLFTTFLTYLLNAFALVSVNPSVVSIYIYLQPFLAALVALVMESDQLTMVKLLAGGLIFIGVFLVSSAQKVASSPD